MMNYSDKEDCLTCFQLKQALKLNPYVKALNLPAPYDTYIGNKAIVSGFGWNHVNVETDRLTGRRTETVGSTTGKLRYAITKVIDRNQCSRMYGDDIDESLVCAQVVQRRAKNPEGVCSVSLYEK